MKRRAIAIAVVWLALGGSLCPHRLDEYLQAALVTVEKERVEVTLRLIPGVAVTPAVVASIDANGDGVISEEEQRAYAERVLGELSLKIDEDSLTPRLTALRFPEMAQMKEGLGEIQIEFAADVPARDGERRLLLENHHQRQISAYLVNCLVPSDPDLQIEAQKRNETQSVYELDYRQSGGRFAAPRIPWWTGAGAWFRRVGFASIFRLGMRHIAEGTDHLLFLLALLLPAPLLAVGPQWSGFAGVRHSAMQILRVVTAFTIGHSVTLALAALGFVQVPSRPIEVLIAVSILVSAVHAFRPLFPGREAAIAAFFGLIHGLAFASTLGQLALARWERVVSILGFNLGIETMQLVVVAATMPSLVLLSLSRSYSAVRVGGALFATCAAAGWIVERLLGFASPVDSLVNGAARYAGWLAAILFLASLVCWSLGDIRHQEAAAA